MHANPNPPIKSVAISFQIADALQRLDGATLQELVNELDKPNSTIHDHLRSLNELGYVVKDGRTFRLGIRFLKLGGFARSRSRFFQVAEQEVQKLAHDTGEHANLLVEENGLGIFIYKEKGPESVRLDTYEGMEVHLHTTALGKSILAEMDPAKRDHIIDEYGLEPVTEKTITDRDVLMDELEEIRDRGYAIDNEERVDGIRCIAAPVKTDGTVVGAVSVSAPRSRMNGERFTSEIPSEVRSTANIIEVNIQHV